MELRERSTIESDFLNGAEFETIPCNLCGGSGFDVLAERDGIGLPIRTVMCRTCGLIFINPRLTKSWYEKYYEFMDGTRASYKRGGENEKASPLTGRPKGTLGVGFDAERAHGRAFAERLRPYIKPGLTIDVGSAEGGILAGMKEAVPIEPVGIEPTVSRAEYATAHGIPTYVALIENISSVAPKLSKAANIVCTKSLNHLLDPRYFFTWAYKTLDDDGRLLLEVKNFRQQARMSGRVYFGIQVDHPFMFTPETLRSFVEAAGFEVLFFDVDETKGKHERQVQKQTGLPIGHARLAARKTERSPFAETFQPKPGAVEKLRREFSPAALYLTYLIRYATPMKNVLRRAGMAH